MAETLEQMRARVAKPFQSLAAEAKAAVDFAAKLSPAGRALAFQMNDKAYKDGSGLATANPAVQAMILEMEGQMAGQGGPTPLQGGDIAEMTGRMPQAMLSANWGNGNISDDQSRQLDAMAQPLDPAGAFGSQGEQGRMEFLRAAQEREAFDNQQQGPTPFDNPLQVAMANAINTRGVPDMRAANKLHSPEAAAKRQEVFDQARKNVQMMAMAGALSRKQSLGVHGPGTDLMAMLAAGNPDMQAMLAPEATAFQNRAINQAAEIEQRGKLAEAGGKMAMQQHEAEMAHKNAQLDALRQNESRRFSLENKRLAMEGKIAGHTQRIDDLKMQLAIDDSDLKRQSTRMELMKARQELKNEERKAKAFDAAAPVRQKEIDEAAKKIDRDRYAEFKDDPVQGANARITDLQATYQDQNLAGRSLNDLPTPIKNFLRHAHDNRKTLGYGAFYETSETAFENYVSKALSGVGGISPGDARRIAEEYYEAH